MEQPRVHCSSAQFCSSTSSGSAAFGPSRVVSIVEEGGSALALVAEPSQARARGPAE